MSQSTNTSPVEPLSDEEPVSREIPVTDAPAKDIGSRETAFETDPPKSTETLSSIIEIGPATSPLDLVGMVIDERYRIEALLGEGGMGAVYLAEQIKLSKKVAIKIVRPEFAGKGDIAERFAREAMAVGRLDHPHVAGAVDYGTMPDGEAYLVMQLVRGESLRELAPVRAGDWVFACEVGAQIADALSAAHLAQIIHRDLKPENVILETRDLASGIHLRVLDFGIARVASEIVEPEVRGSTPGGRGSTPGKEPRKLTKMGVILGTPGYMAPEQALGQAVDERADLYSLGVILWELVAGRLLFPGVDVSAIVTTQLTQPPARLRSLQAGVPLELDHLVARLLDPKREVRPAAAAEARDILRALILTRQLERATLTGARPTLAAHTAEPPAPAFNKLHILALAAIALALVIGGVVLGGSFSSTPLPAVETAIAPEAVPALVVPPPATPAVTPVATAPEMDPLIARDYALLLESQSRETRRTAAADILGKPREMVPPVVLAVAQLERGEGCDAKRAALRTVRELREPRALPAVERIARLPRRGCGLFGHSDCWACLRGEVRRTQQSLEGEADVPAPTPTR